MVGAKVNKPLNPDTQARIVEAAIVCVKRWGIEKVTLNEIAQEAGVTRPTVYSYFGSRDEVVQFALLQSAYTFSAELLNVVSKFKTAQERAIESVMYTLTKLPKEPALELLQQSALANIMNNYALRVPEGNEIRRSLLKFVFVDSEMSDDELDEVTEVATRFVLSLLTLEGPKKRSDQEMRAFLQRRLLPALGLN